MQAFGGDANIPMQSLCWQFSLTAPSGVIAAHSFQDVLTGMLHGTHGAEALPDAWMSAAPEKVSFSIRSV